LEVFDKAAAFVAIERGSQSMPNDVKAYVSAAVAVVALVLAFWSGSPVRPEFGNFVLATAAFMIVAMWIFPEAGGKKKAPRD
jgi:hypothetical protein